MVRRDVAESLKAFKDVVKLKEGTHKDGEYVGEMLPDFESAIPRGKRTVKVGEKFTDAIVSHGEVKWFVEEGNRRRGMNPRYYALAFDVAGYMIFRQREDVRNPYILVRAGEVVGLVMPFAN